MITLLTGENSYEVEQALGRIVKSFDGEPEKYDGTELELHQLPDLLAGQSLFAEKRLVVIRGISGNKQLWEALPDFLERISEDIHLVLVDTSPDKRTRTYKALQKVANVKTFQLWGERDTREAERWIEDEANGLGAKIDSAAARALVERSFVMTEKGQPVIDQWQLNHSLEKLSVFNEITVDVVEKYIDKQPIDSVFNIFETALKGNESALRTLLKDLEPKEDPFRVFGLLSGQVFQLATLQASSGSSADTAKAIGVHPYAAGKLASFARKLSKREIKGIVLAFTEADEDMKLSKADTWVLIERALVKTAKTAGVK